MSEAASASAAQTESQPPIVPIDQIARWEGKPATIQDKIMQGKLASYFGEKTLLEQPFIKNPELTIKGLIDSGIQKFGEKIEVARFTRFSVLSK